MRALVYSVQEEVRHSHTLLLLSNSLYLPHRWNRPIIKAKERENLNRLPLKFYGSLEGSPRPPPPYSLTLTLLGTCFHKFQVLCIISHKSLSNMHFIFESPRTHLQSDGIQAKVPRIPHRIVQCILDSFQLWSVFLQKLAILPQLRFTDDFCRE